MKKHSLWVCTLFLLSFAFLYQNCTPKTTAATKATTETSVAETTVEKVQDKVKDVIVDKTSIPTDPSVRMGQLDNGLKYYIKKNAKPENRAELRLALNAGSILEDDDQQGLAHFVEHMAFNGSTNFEKNELVDYLESVGTKFGPDLNAYTSFDETVYMLQVRTDDEEKLMTGLTVIEDWAGGISFDHEEIDKERGVVESEWRTRLSPDQRMQNKYFPLMYHNSHYAKRLPIGKPEIINNASYETVKRFYNDWYRPNLMAVVIVGDIDMDQMENEIKTRFGKLTNPENERPRTKFSVPKHKETMISICSDKEAPFTRVRLMYKHDHIEVNSLSDYRSRLVRSLYNQMLNARLTELQQSANPPFTFSYSGYGSDVGDMDSYYCYAFTPEGGAVKGLAVLLEENKRVQQHGFTATELERAKVEVLKSAERAVKEQDKTESNRLAMRYVYNYLDNNPIPSPQQNLDLTSKYLPSIVVDEINVLANKWITDENRVVVITAPEKEESPIPSEAEIEKLLVESAAKEVAAYVDDVVDEPLMAEVPKAVEVKNTVAMDEIGTTEITLANGVRVIMKSTDFKNDEIRFTANSPGGSSLYSDEDYQSASYAARIVQEAGIGKFDLNQMDKMMTGKKVSVSPYIGERYEGMNGSASPDDIEIMFQLIHQYFTNPRKDAAVLEAYKMKEKSIYKNLLSNPQYYFMDQTMKIKSQNHPRRGFPTTEGLDQIDLDRAYQIYKERFADASDFTFYFVGNFDPANLTELCAQYLGNLPSIDRDENWKDIGSDYPDGKVVKDLVKGEAPKSYIDMTFHGPFEWNDKNRYAFRSMIDVMRIKLRESMREDKGGVYGVRVSGNTYQYPESEYSINISFNSDPGNVEELIETAMKDIKNAKVDAITEEDLKKVTEIQKQSMVKDLKENRYWIRQLDYAYKNGLDPMKIKMESLEKASGELSVEDLKNAANQYFDYDRFIKIVMEPEPQEEN